MTGLLFPDPPPDGGPRGGEGPRRLFLLDGTAIAYRAFHALSRSRLTDRSGNPTGAVFGFVSTVFRLLREEKPDHLAVCFDPPGPTFRHERYAEYKATREKMPDDLKAQLPVIREVVRALGMPLLEEPGWEADDVLATLAQHAAADDVEVHLVTGDKDLFQLVTDRIRIHNILTRGDGVERLDPAGVEAKFGVPPKHVADVLALMGDSSDNVPGVPGIGAKTAVKLVKAHGGLDDIYANLDAVGPERIRKKLIEHEEQARLSYELVKIPCDAPLDFSFEDARVTPPDMDVVRPLFEELDFKRFLAELPREDRPAEDRNYRTVRTKADLDELLGVLRGARRFAFDTETTGTDALDCTPVGLSFATEPRAAWYVPLNAETPILDADDDRAALLEAFRGLLEDPERPFVGQNAKYDILVLRTAGVRPAGLADDTMVLSFLVDPRERTHNLDDLALRHLEIAKTPTTDIIGKGRDQVTMADVPVEKVADYACEDADVTLRVLEVLEPRMKDSDAEGLYRDIEIPLVGVLADMEERGIRVDADRLGALADELRAREEALVAEIHDLAGEEFNVNSTQQLGNILFEKLQLQGRRKAKRTKTGYKTDAATLEIYADHPIVEKVLQVRTLAKLRGTYLEPLPDMILERTGRIHTSFSQIGAITGRLSSSNPNLQNIPIRTEEGRRIRRAFVPGDDGWTLVSADYSQVELRVLAHLAEDPGFIEAFTSGQDIHRATAARIFEVMPPMVTPELRSRAKAINFGVIYGMGEQRLARTTGISTKEAREFIEAYFRTYPRVKEFHEEQIEHALQHGYVETLFGRRRWIREELLSPRGGIAANARNNAINTPIQGTAADLVKKAMVDVHRALIASDLDAHLLLQVHDELVLECPEDQAAATIELVKTTMESVAELKVPLVVDAGTGADWLEAH